MKLSLLQENLSQALSHTSRFTSSKSQLPILNNILLSTDQGRLKLSATNLELGINYWIGAKIDEEGSITIPSKEITEFISYLPAGKLDLELDPKGLLSVNSVKAQSTFASVPANDFPVLPAINPETAFELDSSLLLDSVSQVAFCAAADDTRPVLTAILCRFTSEDFMLVATDGFRLALKQFRLVNPITLPSGHDSYTFLIPARSLTEVAKLAKANKKIRLGLTPDDHQVVFVLDDIELVSRLLEGDYPPYQRIIPESYTTKLFINKQEFSQAVKMASVFARESANVVRFNIKSTGIELTANAPQIGQNRIALDAKVEGEPLEIAFNYKFINDYLAIAKGDEIVVELNESLTPGFFHDQTDPHFTHIIMPVRIQD
ncbi:MAG TPA: DNA polymerase III subunit beta [Patescibacteria group bacterium]